MEENTVYLRGGKALNMNLDWGVRRKQNMQWRSKYKSAYV